MNSSGERLQWVDLLRGVVMIVMALDHARDFMTDSFVIPTDVLHAPPALFFTRWITHICAPTFMFLAGVGARLSMARGRTRRSLAAFLVTRGLFLVVCEVTVLKVLWHGRYSLLPIDGATLWGLGWSMVGLAALIFLPRGLLAAIGIVAIVGHNALDGVVATSWPWAFVHGGSVAGFESVYPLVPWIGVMALGYVAGDLVSRPRLLGAVGLAVCGAFVLLRLANVYGDPQPFAVEASAVRTLMSFLDCEKYPPSLAFLLMTLGPALALAPLLERWHGRVAETVRIFGRVPLFYYFLHILVLHVVALGLAAVASKPLPWEAMFVYEGGPPIPGWGWPLPVIYVVWVLAVLALVWPCRWYGQLKQRSRFWLLGYV